MSGHSKWSTIKRKKGAKDAARGKIFTKIIKEIQIAAKYGGSDEEANPRLRVAVQNAKSNNMPKANIEKAIKKGTGELEGVNYEEVTFEGYGPGGVAIILETMTDNNKRTVAEVRHLFNKYGGNLGTNGSVAWMFDKKGKILVEKDKTEEDDLFMIATEAGAEDFLTEEDVYEILTDPKELHEVTKALEDNDIPYVEAIVDMIPKNVVKVEEKDVPNLLQLMELFEEHEDMQKLFSNFDIDEEILEKFQE